jgi:hypothetical protein
MIVDMRTYTLLPGTLGAYMKLYGTEGYPVQTGHLGACAGYYFVEIGVQNRVVHFWQYADIAERAQRRARMEADPAWNAYRAKSTQFFVEQRNEIIKPAPFWPVHREPRPAPGIIDLRIYRLHPGKVAPLLKLYEAEGLTTQVRHLGHCVLYSHSDIGPQNQLVHLWGYADLEDRTRRRAAMQADPAWQAYLAKASPMLAHMENAIVRPAPFWKPAA